MSEVDALVAWLTGVLDQTERVAEAVLSPGGWYATAPVAPLAAVHVRAVNEDEWQDEVAGAEQEDAAHIALHDPRAVLARVEAERAIVELHTGPDYWRPCPTCTDGTPFGATPACCQTLRLLAYGHRHDAPGYDPAWAPEGVEVGA